MSDYFEQIYHVWERYLRKIPVERRNGEGNLVSIIHIITSYIRILDFDWLIAGVFSYLGLISFIFTAAGVFA